MKPPNSYNHTRMSFIGIEKLNEMALKLLSEYMPQFLRIPMKFDIDKLINEVLCLPIYESEMYIKHIMGTIVYATMRFPINKKSFIELEPGSILINEILHCNIIENRFTKAHETAHWLIFQKYKSSITEPYACCKGLSLRSDILDINRIEQSNQMYPNALSELQADILANMLLMPEPTFIPLAQQLMDEYGFFNHKMIAGIRIEKQNEVISTLATIYVVPIESVKLHLRCFNMLQ